jgi:adenosylcobinamide-GDP ribazoletransferase
VRPGDVLTAFTLLTRVSLGRFQPAGETPDLARAVWAFPLVGLVVAAAGGLVFWLTHRLGMPPLVGASWLLAATLLMTGAFHEDGLADVADGFGGGRTLARKLEIMRDSRIGTYGVLALALSLLVRAGAVVALGSPHPVWIALIVAAMLGRASIIVLLVTLPPARNDGIAASMSAIPPLSTSVGLLLAAFAALLLLPTMLALVIIAASLAVCVSVARIARAQIGGHTGDVLGCCEVVVECAALSMATCGLGA